MDGQRRALVVGAHGDPIDPARLPPCTRRRRSRSAGPPRARNRRAARGRRARGEHEARAGGDDRLPFAEGERSGGGAPRTRRRSLGRTPRRGRRVGHGRKDARPGRERTADARPRNRAGAGAGRRCELSNVRERRRSAGRGRRPRRPRRRRRALRPDGIVCRRICEPRGLLRQSVRPIVKQTRSGHEAVVKQTRSSREAGTHRRAGRPCRSSSGADSVRQPCSMKRPDPL